MRAGMTRCLQPSPRRFYLFPMLFVLFHFIKAADLSTETDCEDLEQFVQFSQTYDVPNALRNAQLFTFINTDSLSGWSVKFSCRSVFEVKEDTWDSKSEGPPINLAYVKDINNQYLSDLVLNDPNIPLDEFYLNDKANHEAAAVWPEEYINDFANEMCTCGQYDLTHCDKAFTEYQHIIQDKYGVVLGTQIPWAESALIGAGARRVTTVEYREIVSGHPLVDTITPNALAHQYLQGSVEPVDFIFSFSSIEHDGLGRYGDPQNAFGDFETIAKMHCLLKPRGILFLGVPVGRDRIQYNAHRIYGYRRLSVVLSMGFRIIDVVNDRPFRIDDADTRGDTQPIFVLQKF